MLRLDSKAENARRQKRAIKDLLEFIRMTFRQEWFENWHERILCDYLQKLESGEITRLIIQMPPRHGKSEIGSRKFPAWCIGRNPNRPVILGAYAATLALGFSRSVQATVDSEAFKSIFPDIFLSRDHQSVEAWSINNYPEDIFIAAGVGGPVTGKGGGILILDDPIKNAEEAESEVYREKLWQWWQTTFRTRLEPGGSILIMLTRWHEDDLVGRLLELQKADPTADQWIVMNLEAIARQDSEFRNKGEALFPGRFDIDALENIKASIGSRQFEALYQGNPIPPEGSRFKRSWFSKIIPEKPQEALWVRFWDWAVTPEAGDYTAGALCGVDKEKQRFIADMVRGQWDWPAAKKIMIATAGNDGPDVIILVEQVAKDIAMIGELLKELRHRGFRAFPYQPTRKKEVRSMLWEAMAEAGQITLVKGNWIPAFLHEVCSFPFGTHDDQVDAVSGGMEYLKGRMPKKEEVIPKGPLPDEHLEGHRKIWEDMKRPYRDRTDIRNLVM